MSTLNDIKKRISGINTTSKITQAMKLVATAKIQLQKNAFLDLSKFVSHLYELLEDLSKNVDFKEVFDDYHPKTDNDLYVVISSTFGLCGPYNINVCRHLMPHVRAIDKIIGVGERVYSYLHSKGYKNQIVTKYITSENVKNYIETMPLASLVLSEFKAGNYRNVYMVYTKYKNSLVFEPTMLKILPFSNSLFNPEANEYKHQDQMELNEKNQVQETLGSKSTIIKNFIPFMVSTMFVLGVEESRLCEYSSRRNAMESATDNAKEIVTELKQKYNQLRQEKITQEINEIVAGAGE